MLSANCIDPEARKLRAPQDDNGKGWEKDYAVFFIWAMASSMFRFISSAEKSCL